jgi:prevent-host-death family protein
MPKPWQLQHAKNRFSELVDRAITEGPQFVTRRGRSVAVVVSFESYVQTLQPKEPLVDLLLRPEFRALGKLVDRPRAADRDVDL